MSKKIIAIIFILSALLFIINAENEKIPGIKTMREHGTKLSPGQVLNDVREILSGMGLTGDFSYTIFESVLNAPNNDPVYIIDSIEFDTKGFAENITGHIETPGTFGEFIAAGGFGTPVYEAVEPNEFGIIFGRKGNIAIREGVIVRINPFEKAEIYKLLLGSDLYDKIMQASVLFQAYEVIRTPYLENMIIELEGMMLNASSKDQILEDIKKYKNEHKKMNETELIANFLKANKTYLDEIKKSNKQAKDRIKEGGKLLEIVENACNLQVAAIAQAFTQIAADIAEIVLNPKSAPTLIDDYLRKNIPDNTDMDFDDLTNINKYGKYQRDQYNKNIKKNMELYKTVMEIKKNL